MLFREIQIDLTLIGKKVFKMEECNHLAKVLEFSSQYFPRFVFQNRPFQASVAYKKA